MPVQIGSTPDAGFDEPMRLLADCHRRIEMFLGVLARVAGTAEEMLLPEGRRALERATEYFADAAPRHTEDEECSLFPRLRLNLGPELRAALGELDALEADHERASALHDEVERHCRNLLRFGRLAEPDAASLRRLIDELTVLYRRHIDVEERVVFAAAERALGSEAIAAIGQEMADRRGVRWGL